MSKTYIPVKPLRSGTKAKQPRTGGTGTGGAGTIVHDATRPGAASEAFGASVLQELLPRHQFQESHALTIAATPKKTYRALRQLDFSRSWIIRLLFGLRMASALFTRESGVGDKRGHRIEDLETFGFIKLAERSNKHIVLGLVGKFWEADGGIRKMSAQEFQKFQDPQMAKLTWSFHIDKEETGTRLSTETRVNCMGDPAMWRFGTFWTMIRPFSGAIRMEILKAVRDKAEGGAEGGDK